MDEQQPAPPAPPAPTGPSPHTRLKELQAIPDKQRTDAEWDELNDLEIKLASVNRQGAPMPNAQRQGGNPNPRNDQRGGRNNGQQRSGGGGGGGRNNEQRKKFHGRRPRPA